MDIYLDIDTYIITQMLHAGMQMNHARMMTKIAEISSYLVLHFIVMHIVNMIILIPIYISLQR